MKEILTEDECNDTYGRIRMYQALTLKQPKNVDIPSERTVYRIMEEIGISHHPRRKPNGITKADREARKSDDLLKRDFHAEEPLSKCVTDITEIKASDGKLYVSAVFDCFDSSVIGLAMDTNMKAPHVCRHWKILLMRTPVSVEPLSIATGEASTPVSFTGMLSRSTAYSKV